MLADEKTQGRNCRTCQFISGLSSWFTMHRTHMALISAATSANARKLNTVKVIEGYWTVSSEVSPNTEASRKWPQAGSPLALLLRPWRFATVAQEACLSSAAASAPNRRPSRLAAAAPSPRRHPSACPCRRRPCSSVSSCSASAICRPCW